MQGLTVLRTSCCAPGAPPLQRDHAEALARRFKALADTARVAIVNLLAREGEACVCQFEAHVGLSQPTVSHHLKVLREAGLVQATRRGTWAYYRLVPEVVEDLAFALGGAPPTELERAG